MHTPPPAPTFCSTFCCGTGVQEDAEQHSAAGEPARTHASTSCFGCHTRSEQTEVRPHSQHLWSPVIISSRARRSRVQRWLQSQGSAMVAESGFSDGRKYLFNIYKWVRSEGVEGGWSLEGVWTVWDPPSRIFLGHLHGISSISMDS